MATLREYFQTDFNRVLNVQAEHRVTIGNTQAQIPFPVRIHLDFDAAARFVSIYVPAEIDPIPVARHYADDIQRALQIADTVVVGAGMGGIEMRCADLQFTGRVFLYAARTLDSNDIEGLSVYGQQRGVHFVVRTLQYAKERARWEKPEAFICHDSRDKSDVAEPIARGLRGLMCPVWYDEFSLKVGDSLRESIERGIKEARACIVVISASFLSNGGWTKAEFDSIYTREVIEKKRVMLPVWHQVTPQEVYDYSPRLADRVGLSMDLGVDEVVRRLHLAIRSRAASDALDSNS